MSLSRSTSREKKMSKGNSKKEIKETKETNETEENNETEEINEKNKITRNYYTLKRSEIVKKDSFSSMLRIPRDDLSVDIRDRELRVLTNLTEKEDLQKLPLFIQDRYKAFFDSWVFVQRKYRTYQKKKEVPIIERKFPEQKFEVDHELLKDKKYKSIQEVRFEDGVPINKEEKPIKLTEEDFEYEFIKSSDSQKSHLLNVEKRSKHYVNIFESFSNIDIRPVVGDPRSPSIAFRDLYVNQLFVHPISLEFAIPEEIEPFFCTLALYDLATQSKLSEDFHFELNKPNLQKMTYYDKNYDKTTIVKNAIFSFPNPSKELVFILRIDQVLKGSYDDTIDPYLKGKSISTRKLQTLQKTYPEIFANFGEYRQAFAWSFAPLFKMNALSNQIVDLFGEKEDFQFTSLYKTKELITDEKIFNFILNEAGGSGKKKTIPGSMKMRVARLEKNSEMIKDKLCLDPSLYPVALSEEFMGDMDGNVWVDSKLSTTLNRDSVSILEIQNFADMAKQEPKLSYVNNLYIYPTQLMTTVKKTYVIKIQLMEDDSNLNGSGMSHFYGVIRQKKFVNFRYTKANFQKKAPKFHDEIKLLLPQDITEKHHLLFTYYHAHCKEKKPKKIADVIGYSVLPLFDPNLVIEREIKIPILKELPNEHYLEAIQESGEKMKQYLDLRLRAVSSLYPQDGDIMGLLYYFGKKGNEAHQKLMHALERLRTTRVANEEMFHYFPTIFSIVSQLMCGFGVIPSRNSRDQQWCVLRLFHAFASVAFAIQNDQKHVDNLKIYIEHLFKNPTDYSDLFAHVAELWRAEIDKLNMETTVESSGSPFVNPAWFFYEVVIKSAILFLEEKDLLRHDSRKKYKALSREFLKNIRGLVQGVQTQVLRRMSTGLTVAKRLNRATALFLKDLLHIYNIEEVFELMQKYIRGFSGNEDAGSRATFKLDFLQIVLETEHYFALNIPVCIPFETSTTNMAVILSERHFLVGLLLREIFTIIASSHGEDVAQTSAISLLRDVLHKHETDPRLQEKNAMGRIGALYLLLVVFFIDNIAVCNNMSQDSQRNLLVSLVFVLRYIDSGYFLDWWGHENMRRRLVFFDLLRLCITVFEYPGLKQLRTLSEKRLQESPTMRTAELEDVKERLEQRYANSAIMSFRDRTPTDSPTRRFSSFKKTTPKQDVWSDDETSPQSKNTPRKLFMTYTLSNRPVVGDNTQMEANLSVQVSLTILNIIETLMVNLHSRLSADDAVQDSSVLKNLFLTMIKLFETNQSDTVVLALFASARLFVRLYRDSVFAQNNSLLQTLFHKTFAKTISPSKSVRCRANAFAFLLIKTNFKHSRNISKSEINSIIALSKLVGDPAKFQDDLSIRSAFLIMQQYASKEKLGKGQFNLLVKKHSEELTSILRDGAKLAKCQHDPEMTAELYLKIADGYKKAPDLRLTWLESLKNFNTKHENNMEAFVNGIHMCALVGEYLRTTRPECDWIAQGALTFENIARSCAEELFPRDVVDIQRLAHSPSFTTRWLELLLVSISDLANRSGFYEAKFRTDKLVMQIYEQRLDWNSLASLHSDLQKVFQNLAAESANNIQNRGFGAFYRVAFYGDFFADLDPNQFIYREPDFTHLFTLAEKLTKQYERSFGTGNVEIIQKSQDVDPKKLQPNRAYLQITSVEPYFSDEENIPRVSRFQRSFNLSKFFFETPFTKSGKPHGNINEQYLTKTILSCRGTFPYLIKRLPIINKKQSTLSPIQTSTDNMKKKNIQIQSILDSSLKNINELQSLLNGTCLASVNVGPAEIAKVFLTNPRDFPSDDVKMLISEFRLFFLNLNLLLKEHERLANDDARPFHEAVVNGFDKLKAQVEPFLDFF
ncbi:dedicator of cytokinesis dock [Anaeramoeba ignava]|uniref:Dedicator of cytokinesis dock n=1 Tax=Anaeramoeba ignava TaxID=1746090 RepID=A0A9Q0LQS8_ANAIG|nr:dedicator of cytokinesis dock [Anaeramoeba ignava]